MEEKKMKNMQDTSLDAFTEVRKTLGKRQQLVLDAIREMGNATDLEVSSHLGITIRSIGPRRNELLHMNLVKKIETRQCKISKGTAIAWGVISG